MGERVRGRANGDKTEKAVLWLRMRFWGMKDRFWRSAAIGLGASTAIGLTLGAIGPFGSYLNGTILSRTAFWVVCFWGGGLAFGLAVPILNQLARRWGIPVWIWVPPTIVMLNFVPTVLSRILAVKIWPEVRQIGLVEWYSQSLVLSTLSIAGLLWVMRSPADVPTTLNATSSDPRDRLPPRLGRTVLCLQMEDHYVRVHTPMGSALVLMSLSQAIAGLKDIEGAQTHRSWWVARGAIEGVIEDGRKLRLSLSGGIEAPISRARVGVLRQDGWLGAASKT